MTKEAAIDMIEVTLNAAHDAMGLDDYFLLLEEVETMAQTRLSVIDKDDDS